MKRGQSYQSIIYSTSQDYKSYHVHQNNGPQVLNHYGLSSPRSKEKKNLIDQIINKCEKFESPKISLNKCPQARSPTNPFSRSKIF